MEARERAQENDERKEQEEKVMERIREITHDQVKSLLDAKSEVNPDAGIIIVPLSEVQPVELKQGMTYDYYAARVLPHSAEHPNYVNPHYHLHVQEPYRFLQGADMEMNTGTVNEGSVEWAEPQVVNAGEEFVIGEGRVHSLCNNGTTPVDFVFACPKSHLVDNTPEAPDGDRYFTKDLENGIPPRYAKSPLQK